MKFPEVKLLQFNYCANFQSWNHPHRNAPFWRLYWNSTAGAVIRTEQEKIELKPDIIVLIPPHTNYSTSNYQPFDQFYLHFVAEAPFDRVERRPIIFPAEAGAGFIPHLEEWLGGDAALLPIRLYSVIFDLIRQLPERIFTDSREKLLDPRIQEAVTIISHEYTSPLANGAIARKVGMSLNNFLRLFKQEIGVSPHQYLMNQRMERAQALLLHSEQSVEAIAVYVGFTDRYHFSKAFKHLFLMTPVEYRRQFRQSGLAPREPA